MRNVLAAGHARLTVGGQDVELINPRLVDEQEAWEALGDAVRRPPRVLRIREYLRTDIPDG